jgi:hypothetical protein
MIRSIKAAYGAGYRAGRSSNNGQMPVCCFKHWYQAHLRAAYWLGWEDGVKESILTWLGK